MIDKSKVEVLEIPGFPGLEMPPRAEELGFVWCESRQRWEWTSDSNRYAGVADIITQNGYSALCTLRCRQMCACCYTEWHRASIVAIGSYDEAADRDYVHARNQGRSWNEAGGGGKI